MKKIIITLLVVVSGLGLMAHADVPSTSTSFYYVFHLYINTANQLVADRNFKFNYDIIPGTYSPPTITTQYPYHGAIINLSGANVASFTFMVAPGKLSIAAPYVPDGQKAIFYDNKNNAVLTISVSASSFCNDDGICNADRGEDYLSCPNDCKQASLPTPVPSTTPAAAAGGSSGLLSGIIYAVIGLGLAFGAWWLLKKKRGGPGSGPTSGSMPQMPQFTLPSSGQALPTPLPPPNPQNPVQ